MKNMKNNLNAIKSLIEDSGCFDKGWYIKQYPEATKNNTDPLDDYIQNWKCKKRNPNAHFSNEFYLSQTPNSKNIKNPLAHYIKTGWKELKNPSDVFNTWWYIVNHMPGIMYEKNPLQHFYTTKLNKIKEISTTIYEPKRLSVNQKIKFNKNSIALFNKIPQNENILYKAIESNLTLQQYDLADMFSEQLVLKYPKSIQAKKIRAMCLEKRKKWRELKSCAKMIIRLDRSSIAAYIKLGKACQKLEKHPEAVTALKNAIKLGSKNHEAYYMLALSLEKTKDNQAVKFYEQAAQKLGIPINKYATYTLHKNYKNWLEAANELENKNIENENIIKYLTEYAFTLEKTYQWEKAEKIYKKISKTCNSTSYQYGNLLERLEKYEEAISQYNKHIESNKVNPQAKYRLAYSLFKCKKYKEACEQWLAYIKTNSEPSSYTSNDNTKWLDKASRKYYESAKNYLNTDFEKAEHKLKLACLNASYYNRKLLIDTGKILFKNIKYEESCQYLMESLQYKKSYLNTDNLDLEDTKQIYKEHLETTTINKNHILYESAHGRVIGDNPYYIFKYILNNKQHSEFIHIWSVFDEERIPEKLKKNENIVFVREGSYGYLKHLASAKFLINSHTFKPFFTRRIEQLYLMTWHGTPIKKLGVHYHNAKLDGKNVSRNILQSTHLIFPNAFTKKIFMDAYQVESIYKGQIKITGYPRIDAVFQDRCSKNIRKSLGIDNSLPIVLYAPTFRGEVGNPNLDLEKLKTTLEALSSEDYNLIYNGHQFQDETPKNLTNKTIKVNNIEINCLLNKVDALITDYSSILFDYLPTRKPIFLYPYDYEEYKKERGIYFDLEQLNLNTNYTPEEIKTALEAGFNEKAWKNLPSEQLISKYSYNEIGSSAKEATDFLFNTVQKKVNLNNQNTKKQILIYMGSFIPNGITTSFLSLMQDIDHSSYEITLALDPWTISSYPQRVEKLEQLSKSINILPRISYPVADVDETSINSYFQSSRGKLSGYTLNKLKALYNNEFYRLYGSTNFDFIIDFNGYDFFWTALFALKSRRSEKKIIWLHNDMLSETNTRFPHLKSSLALLHNFDRLVSVSKSSNNINRNSLTQAYNIDVNKFLFARNTFISDVVNKRANEKININISNLKPKYKIIGTAARLSYEKGIDRLINSFYRINKKHPNTKLIIIGQGPEQENLFQHARELKIDKSVIFTGYLENPYPLIKEFDVFILASRYEGQGIVLLEALSLGVPVISTNIPGPDDILLNHPSCLVDSSEEGLYQGMDNELGRKSMRDNLNYNFKEYTKQARTELNKVLYLERNNEQS